MITWNWTDRRGLTIVALVLLVVCMQFVVRIVNGGNSVAILTLLGIGPVFILMISNKRASLLAYIVVTVFLVLAPVIVSGKPGAILAYAGKSGSGIGINAVVMAMFIFAGGLHILHVMFNDGRRLVDYFANPGVRWLFAFGVALCASLLVQTWVAGQPPSWVFRKGRSYISLLVLSPLLWILFDREGDEWLILKFSLGLFGACTVLFFSSGTIGKDIQRAGETFYRVQFVALGGNGVGTYYSMYLPLLVLMAQRSQRWKLFWWTITIGAFAMALLSSTRATYIALALCILFWLWLEKGLEGLILGVLLVGLILVVFWGVWNTLFIEDVGSGVDSFTSRIENSWRPALVYLSSTNARWYGDPARDFNSFVQSMYGYRTGSHNMVIQLAIEYGVPVIVCWLGFWGSSILAGVRTVRGSGASPHKQMLIACAVSLALYFVNAQSAAMLGTVFILPVFMHFYLLQRSWRETQKCAVSVDGM